jgi:N-acetylglucosamine kinase
MVTDRYVVGVDGGASKTVALIGTTDGRILGRGETGPSNYHNVGAVAASRAIKISVVKAQRQAGLIGRIPETAVVALAAIDSTKDKRVVNQFVQRIRVARETFVIHDSVAALYAATHGKPGIIVNSGTGCFAAGISEAGKYARVGGWGYLIDDKGSAFDIGMKAITMAFRMMDGRTPRTKLISLLRRRFRVGMFDEILNVVYGNRMSVEEIARLAPFVSKAARKDKICREILKEAGISLAELACTAARLLKMTRNSFALVTVGGGFRSGRYLLGPFTFRVREECPRAHIINLSIEPAKGALLLAAKLSQHGSHVTSQRDGLLSTIAN